jgi:hypothetical protein
MGHHDEEAARWSCSPWPWRCRDARSPPTRRCESFFLMARSDISAEGVLTIMLENAEKDPLSCSGRKLRTTLFKQLIVIAFAALLVPVLVPSVWGQASPGVITNYPFRDSFARHYHVERSPRIEIKGGISGPVTTPPGKPEWWTLRCDGQPPHKASSTAIRSRSITVRI